MYIRKRYVKIIKIIVCILVLVTVVFGVFFHFNEDFRVNFRNYMLELKESNADDNSVLESDKRVKFNYMPEGFVFVQNSSTKSTILLNFEKGEQYFSYSKREIGGNVSYDTEDAVIEYLKINNCAAVYSSNKNINILFWHDNVNFYDIIGNIPKEEMIKIAENAEILG